MLQGSTQAVSKKKVSMQGEGGDAKSSQAVSSVASSCSSPRSSAAHHGAGAFCILAEYIGEAASEPQPRRQVSRHSLGSRQSGQPPAVSFKSRQSVSSRASLESIDVPPHALRYHRRESCWPRVSGSVEERPPAQRLKRQLFQEIAAATAELRAAVEFAQAAAQAEVAEVPEEVEVAEAPAEVEAAEAPKESAIEEPAEAPEASAEEEVEEPRALDRTYLGDEQAESLLGSFPVPLGISAWEWPLSRNEKKSLVLMLDRQELTTDRDALADERDALEARLQKVRGLLG